MDRSRFIDALTRLGGTPRVLIYDVEESGVPERTSPSRPFLRGGSASWWSFVERRRALDDGQDLTLLISLRGLRTDERLLIVNWGTAYANAFLVVEPYDPWLDLTDDSTLEEIAAKAGSHDPNVVARRAYAEWIYWVREPSGVLESRAATLSLSDENATLWQSIWERLPKTFSREDFLSHLTQLTLYESELFTGAGRQVGRAIVPFLTRLGLPILYDAHHVIGSVRQLVAAGLTSVQDPLDGNRTYQGPFEPIPDDFSDERVALMLR